MLINATTQKLIESFIHHPTSSLIIEGTGGMGKQSIIDMLISDLLGKKHRNNVLIAQPEEGKLLGVEAIRELKRSLTTVVGGKDIGRIAIVKRAESMTHEAQNALLKLLEEPTKNTVVILDVTNAGNLLETIRSRCQVIRVMPIHSEQAYSYADTNGYEPEAAKKAFLLSGGETELFIALLKGEHSELLEQIQIAKTFLSQSVFDRLSLQKQFADSQKLEMLIAGLLKVCEAAMHASKSGGVARWNKLVVTIKKCDTLLSSNTPVKLVYLQLCTEL